jgi:hypothetical protein
MVARDDHSTSTRFLALLDEVDLVQPFPPVRRPQLLSEIVIADASRVHHRFGREDVLRMKWLDLSSTRSGVHSQQPRAQSSGTLLQRRT